MTDHKTDMDYLDKLEAKSIYILREAYASFDKLCMLCLLYTSPSPRDTT